MEPDKKYGCTNAAVFFCQPGQKQPVKRGKKQKCPTYTVRGIFALSKQSNYYFT